MSNDNWWEPKKLKEAEEKARHSGDIESIDGDFGAYRRAFLSGIENSRVNSHNDLNPLIKIDALSKVLHMKNPSSILDVGCGLGIATGAMAKYFPNAKVMGVDISEDAIAYAKLHYPTAEFKAVAINPEMQRLGRFEYIFCFEFYPFTRNRDVQAQAQYLECLADQLAPNGKIVIYQKWNEPNSLSAIYKTVQTLLPNLQMSVHSMPTPKLVNKFPYWLAYGAAILLNTLLQREILRRFFVVQKIS
jgi:2-polyprenyl-3-methyl-5-hydroxy-6-metoxy-1,4-benzoquinol methylase